MTRFSAGQQHPLGEWAPERVESAGEGLLGLWPGHIDRSQPVLSGPSFLSPIAATRGWDWGMGLAGRAAASPCLCKVYPRALGTAISGFGQRLDSSIHLPEILSIFFLHPLIPHFYSMPGPLVGSLNEPDGPNSLGIQSGI